MLSFVCTLLQRHLSAIILVKYFNTLIYESDEINKQKVEMQNMSCTKFAEITIYPLLDYVIYIVIK